MLSTLRNRRGFLGLLPGLIACNLTPAVDQAEAVVCPEIAGTADPLELDYAEDPRANGRIKAFVATSRGLADVVVEMERMALDACDHMRADLGVALAAPVTSVQQACAPVARAIAEVQAAGVEIRIALVAPQCGADSNRSSRCSAFCAPSASDCAALCNAQAALYAECTLPAVSVLASSEAAEVVRLVQTLEQHLPALLFAEVALGKRLVEQAGTLVALSASLPRDLGNAGPRGIACVTLAAALIGKAATRLNGVIGASSAATARLDPEVHPSRRSSL
jgi:hypothetical protein